MTDRATRGQERVLIASAPPGPTIVSRFAPSPTGRLHLGHALSAVLAHDCARALGGAFILRIDDIDTARARPAHVAAIIEDLDWLGLRWDVLVRQSGRLAHYDAALAQLVGAGLAYPCFCTRAGIAREVAASIAAPHGADGPLYPGICRALTAAERGARLAHTAHCWRLDARAALARAGPLVWHDARSGAVAVDAGALGDIILKGRDAPASYHLACVVDDAAFAVSDVVRGADIFASTHAQVLLQAVLGLPTPRYHHHRLVVDAQGTRLAKRRDAPTLESVRAAGEEGHALADALRAGTLPIGFGFAS